MEAVCEIVGFEEASESVEGLVTESEGGAPKVFQTPTHGLGKAVGGVGVTDSGRGCPRPSCRGAAQAVHLDQLLGHARLCQCGGEFEQSGPGGVYAARAVQRACSVVCVFP